MDEAQHSSRRSSFRKATREAVAFALLGFCFFFVADFVLDSKHTNPRFEALEPDKVDPKASQPAGAEDARTILKSFKLTDSKTSPGAARFKRIGIERLLRYRAVCQFPRWPSGKKCSGL